MLFAIITAWLAYKRATDTGRNGIIWAIVGAAVFIGTQLLVSLGIGVFLGIGIAFWGWSESVFDDYAIYINIFAILASFFTSWILLRYLAGVPDDDINQPPAPPQF